MDSSQPFVMSPACWFCFYIHYQWFPSDHMTPPDLLCRDLLENANEITMFQTGLSALCGLMAHFNNLALLRMRYILKSDASIGFGCCLSSLSFWLNLQQLGPGGAERKAPPSFNLTFNFKVTVWFDMILHQWRPTDHWFHVLTTSIYILKLSFKNKRGQIVSRKSTSHQRLNNK